MLRKTGFTGTIEALGCIQRFPDSNKVFRRKPNTDSESPSEKHQAKYKACFGKNVFFEKADSLRVFRIFRPEKGICVR